ncbi:MAG: hypothetical protein ACRDZ3_19550 [Acidimicrobiia bacterium]
MATHDDQHVGLLEPILGDGRPLLLATAGSLFFAGGFMLFLAATGEFLPHDIHYLGMTADDLCRVASCRIVDFMIHDRAAFGGTLLGLSVLYVWLTVFPLARKEAGAWWAWLASATAGFGGFLAYLGYGYLDTWHGVGTLLLLPVFVTGMVRSRSLVARPMQLRSVALAGAVSLIAALGIHLVVGYTNFGHLLPALAASATLVTGIALAHPGVPAGPAR